VSGYPVFTKGQMFESKTHGQVEFMRMDNYCGQITYEFKSHTYGGTYNWLPEVLGQHLYLDTAPQIGKFPLNRTEQDDEIERLRATIKHGHATIAALKAELEATKLGENFHDHQANTYAQQVAHWIEKHDALKAELAEAKGVKDLWEKTAKSLGAEFDALKVEAEKDYQGMREFQVKFIAADQELRALKAQSEPIRHKTHCMKLDFYDERDWGCTCGAEATTPQPADRDALTKQRDIAVAALEVLMKTNSDGWQIPSVERICHEALAKVKVSS
jgi:hypothetical protein